MSSRVQRHEVELQGPTVEPGPFSDDLSSYPLPRLKLAGGLATFKLSVVVLENGFLRATFCPALGGRMVALHDVRAGRDVFSPNLEPVEEGVRGLLLPHGVQVSLNPELDSMSPCDHMVHEPVSDEGPAAFMTFSSLPGSGLSLQVVWSLPPEEECLRVEARVFNRTLDFQRIELSVVNEGGRAQLSPESSLSPRDTVALQARLSVADGRVALDVPNFSEHELGVIGEQVERDPASLPIHLRGAAHIRLANAAALEGDLASALDHVDSALATLADDPLAWWQRAVLARLNGEDNDQELTTAHALSPLEPALRAEAFLAMPQTHSKEPSAVLKGLSPDDFHETVHLLVEAGLYQEATRLMDEAQRHQEHPLLRYMHAWCLMQTTRMEVEASFELQKAGKAPIEPPFPWRPLEVRAVRELAQRFSKDERLRALVGLLDKRSGPAT